jgi:hypothetical protein
MGIIDEVKINAQHTPGPWNFHRSYYPFPGTPLIATSRGDEENEFEFLHITIAKGDIRLAEVLWDNANNGGVAPVATVDEMRANAMLMRAAPELLEALKGLIKVYGATGNAEQMIRVKVAIEAIAKAEGK